MSTQDTLNKDNIPVHVAIIMDGNGRWAQNNGLARCEGHARGAQQVRTCVEVAAEIGVKYLTFYAFSVENWNRPQDEVNSLMSLLVESIASVMNTMLSNNVRLMTIGDRDMLPENVRLQVDKAVEASCKNTGITVVIALSYGSRREILNAAKKLLTSYAENPFDIQSLTEDDFSKKLYTADIPDPDLLIRTSGELRISNFLLWQISYSELYFTDILWPEFGKQELINAIFDYQQRQRRFGKTSLQIAGLK